MLLSLSSRSALFVISPLSTADSTFVYFSKHGPGYQPDLI
jgi:hypothetical protein